MNLIEKFFLEFKAHAHTHSCELNHAFVHGATKGNKTVEYVDICSRGSIKELIAYH